MFLAEDINYLNHLIAHQEVSLFKKVSKNSSDINPSNIWMIHMNNENDSSDITTLSEMFKETPLRLDSYVFGFYEIDKGNS